MSIKQYEQVSKKRVFIPNRQDPNPDEHQTQTFSGSSAYQDRNSQQAS